MQILRGNYNEDNIVYWVNRLHIRIVLRLTQSDLRTFGAIYFKGSHLLGMSGRIFNSRCKFTPKHATYTPDFRRHCGTWNMAFSFMLLPRAATITLCSKELLLAALFHETSCAATTLWSSSQTSSPLPNPFTPTPLLIEDYSPSPTLQAPWNSGTDYYASNQLLARNNITLSAPHQRC